MSVYKRVKIAANDHEDMVNIVVGDLGGRVAYQTALELAQALRLACKSAARHDRAAPDFWLTVDMEDLDDQPLTHRQFRRSKQVPTVERWQTRFKNTEVCLLFDGRGEILGYEDGIKLHQMIRRAGRRAKAWAGDSSPRRMLMTNLTDAEADDRLNLPVH